MVVFFRQPRHDDDCQRGRRAALDPDWEPASKRVFLFLVIKWQAMCQEIIRDGGTVGTDRPTLQQGMPSDIERAMVPVPRDVLLSFNVFPIYGPNGALITGSRREECLACERGYVDDAALLLEPAL